MRLRSILVVVVLVFSLLMNSYSKEMTPLNGLVMVVKNVSGDKENQMTEQAKLEAVKECCARVYLSKNIILARDILDKYIEKKYGDFVYSIEILDKTFKSGKTHMNLKIFVNNEKLIKDLEEKKFLYAPKLHPYFYVFLEEKLDGQTANHSIGNTAISNALRDLRQRTSTVQFDTIASNVNIFANPETTAKAIEAAQKNEIEVIITGTSETKQTEEKELYYDNYRFFETKIDLKIVRVDTGEILAESKTSGLATNIDPERAKELSIIRACMNATGELVKEFEKVWDKTLLDKADYKVMFTGLAKPDLDVLGQTMKSLGKDTKIYVKSYYNGIAVINVDFKGDEKELIRFFETFPQPTLKIISNANKKMEITVRE